VRRASAALLAVLVLPACGLPLEQGVRPAGPVAAEQVQAGPVQEYNPGPRPGAGAREIVVGFLNAQTSAEDDRALARQFLAPDAREEWDDDATVVVYDPDRFETELDSSGGGAPDDQQQVVVRTAGLATIDSDGAYATDETTREEVYRLRRVDGELRLVQVPSGLRLTPQQARLSFLPREVYFLPLLPTGPGVDAPLVADRVFLPAEGGPDAVVARLLDGPSGALRGAVATGVPDGTGLRRPVEVADGVATVDLTAAAAAATGDQRRQLSAQLFWTLQGTSAGSTGLRLLVDGEPLEVPGVGALQGPGDWAGSDPVGPAGRTAALYVADGRLQRLDGTPTRSPATDGQLPVRAVASAPSSGRLALLTEEGGQEVVRTGPAAGPFEPVLSGVDVRSLSWGSGERGLFLVAAGGDGAGAVLHLPATGPLVEVEVDRPPAAGPLQVVRLSRDGARVAAVFGAGVERRLHVGRVEPGPVPRLTDLRSVAPGLPDVADLSWESGTSLVVLAPLGTPNALPVRVAVDGSEVEPVRTLGLVGVPQAIAAAPGRPLVVGALLDGAPVLLFEQDGLFRRQPGTGQAPVYPG
jgi:hypothetical protein